MKQSTAELSQPTIEQQQQRQLPQRVQQLQLQVQSVPVPVLSPYSSPPAPLRLPQQLKPTELPYLK